MIFRNIYLRTRYIFHYPFLNQYLKIALTNLNLKYFEALYFREYQNFTLSIFLLKTGVKFFQIIVLLFQSLKFYKHIYDVSLVNGT